MKISRERMFYIAAVVVTASVIASSMIALMTTNTSVDAKEQTTAVAQDEITYVLSQKDGRVAGFVKGVEIPYIRTDTAVNSLPYDIQRKLKKGVEFDTEEEMRKVMDEWCS